MQASYAEVLVLSVRAALLVWLGCSAHGGFV
jgi:hypothetical protein